MLTIRGLLRWCGVAALLALCAGCHPIEVAQALLPSSTYVSHPAIAYGADPRQRLDVYVPTGNPDATKPVVVFFYGGRWQGGRREDYRFVGEALAAQGFVAVIPDYRVYPQVQFPVFVDDSAAAVAWTVAHAAQYGANPEHVFLMGHSAGAQIAALLALDRHYLANAGVAAGRVRGFIGLAGPYDFLPLTDPVLERVFGAPDNLARTQPINFVSANAPPMLLLHGLDDTTVLPRNSEHLAAAARAQGTRATLIEYPDYGHIGLVIKLAAPFRGNSSVATDVATFIRQN